MNNRERNWVADYHNSHAYDLSDVYSRWSRDKEIAFRHCYEAMQREGGHDLRIISANTFHFTVGWIRPDENLHVATRDNDYIIDLSELPF